MFSVLVHALLPWRVMITWSCTPWPTPAATSAGWPGLRTGAASRWALHTCTVDWDHQLEQITKNGAEHKMAQPYWGAEGLRFGWVKVPYMSRLSTKNNNPTPTGSQRNFMLKVFSAILKTAPLSVNSSIIKHCRSACTSKTYRRLLTARAFKTKHFKNISGWNWT